MSDWPDPSELAASLYARQEEIKELRKLNAELLTTLKLWMVNGSAASQLARIYATDKVIAKAEKLK